MRNLFDSIQPSVERPNVANQVGRPLLLAVVLLALNLLALLAAMLTALLVGPWAGAWLAAGVLLYALRVNAWWPLVIDWHARALAQRRAVLRALAAAAALLLLQLTGNWPQAVADPSEHALLFWRWQYEAGRVYAFGGGLWRELRWLQWLRLALVIVIPTTLPGVLRLLVYRFSVEIAYPTWSDSVKAQGLRFVDPLGLLRITPPTEPIAPSAPASSTPHTAGAL
jgi:hypothetical protein